MVAYNDNLDFWLRRVVLERLARERPELIGAVEGYMEMLQMQELAMERRQERFWREKGS